MKLYNNITREEWEEIEAYLDGKMSKEEEKLFEQKMTQLSQLNEKVREVKLTRIGIEKASLLEELEQIDLQNEHLRIVSEPKKKRRRLITLLSLAAIFIGVLFLSTQGTAIFKGENERLFKEFYKPDPGLLTAMGETDNYEFEVGMVAYKSTEYKKAIQRWEPLLAQHPKNDTLNYFMGNSWLALDKPEQAEPYYREVLNIPESEFKEETEWYLGLTLIKLKKTDEAARFIRQSNHKRKDDLLQKIK